MKETLKIAGYALLFVFEPFLRAPFAIVDAVIRWRERRRYDRPVYDIRPALEAAERRELEARLREECPDLFSPSPVSPPSGGGDKEEYTPTRRTADSPLSRGRKGEGGVQ